MRGVTPVTDDGTLDDIVAAAREEVGELIDRGA